jgi:hypothetical protein
MAAARSSPSEILLNRDWLTDDSQRRLSKPLFSLKINQHRHADKN